MKTIIKRTLIVVIALVFSILIFGTIKQTNYNSKVNDEFKPIGKFSDIGENKIHYNYLDEGDFTLVMVGGLGETMHTWSKVADELNERGRVFMYDRSGLGFSEGGVLPRSIDKVSEELHTVLKKENISGPYLIIGHSIGGFIARYYAKKYPKDIVGLYLIDPYQGDVGNGDHDPNNDWSLSYKLINWSFRKMAWSGIPFYLLPNPPHPTYKTSKAIKTYGLEAYAEKISLKQFQKYAGKGKETPLYLLKADNKKDPFNDLHDKWDKQIFAKYSNDLNKYYVVDSGHHIHIEKPEVFLKFLDGFLADLKLINNDKPKQLETNPL